MNVLPLILALILVLSVLTIGKFEQAKNQIIVHREYQAFLKDEERVLFNLQQKRFYKSESKSKKGAEPTHRQINFAYLVKKDPIDTNINKAKQHRLLILDLMKIVYGEATFFKEMEKKRPQFLEELLQAIEEVAKKAPKSLINRIEDIVRLDLEDPELQKVFYHMLKGTVKRDKLKSLPKESSIQEKAYPSLLNFIQNGTDEIKIGLCPKEILKAIFLKDEVVEAICKRRQELSSKGGEDPTLAFRNEFQDKRRPDIDPGLLNFKISPSDKTVYD